MATTTPDEPALATHGSYQAPDADLILESADRVLFRVHSLIMTMASTMFRDMLGIPRVSVEGIEEPVPVFEHSRTLAIMLDIVYPNATSPERMNVADMQAVAEAAHKYDMPKVISHLRMIFRNMQPGDLSAHSLEMYALACKFDWRGEANLASTQTLRVDLNARNVRGGLEALDTKSLLQLQELHRWRVQGVVKAVRTIYCSSHSVSCPVSKDHSMPITSDLTWSYLENRVRAEMEACPMGDALRNLEFWSAPEFVGLGTSKCRHCQRDMPFSLNVQMAVTRALSTLPSVVDDLPKTELKFSFLPPPRFSLRFLPAVGTPS